MFKEQYSKFYEEFAKKCPSNTGCKQTSYFISESFGANLDAPENTNTYVTLQYTNAMVEYRTEVVSYNFHSFLADLGGYLGMTIGLSFLSISEWFISSVNYLIEQRGNIRFH